MISQDCDEINLKIGDIGSSNFYISENDGQEIEELGSYIGTETDQDTTDYHEELEKNLNLQYLIDQHTDVSKEHIVSTKKALNSKNSKLEKKVKTKRLKYGANSFHGTFGTRKNAKVLSSGITRLNKVSLGGLSKQKLLDA